MAIKEPEDIIDVCVRKIVVEQCMGEGSVPQILKC